MRGSALPVLTLLTLALPVPALAQARVDSVANCRTVSQGRTAADTTADCSSPRDTTHRSATPSRLETVTVVGKRGNESGYAIAGPLSSTKTSTPLRDIPQAATIVTSRLIHDQAMQGMADVVQYIPGITMGQGEGNRDQPTIRGNASTADFFVDGIRDDVQYYRDLYNVDRVEALKGPNALLFGRGGGGGILNRVTKEAEWAPRREITLQGGSFNDRRAAVDLDQVLTPTIAARLNGMYENSGLYRNDFNLERYGINPTVTIAPASQNTRVVLGYEFFSDHRTADRGVPSFNGRPVDTDPSAFFGNPDVNYVDARVNAANATISHETASGVTIRNHTRFASYDKIYQNVYPKGVNATGDQAQLAAYNHSTPRTNLFNQTDVTYDVTTGSVRHTLLAGLEVGRQASDNFRNTGYFDNTSTSTFAPITNPTTFTPVTFRQSATDADNHVTNTAASLYVQDQVALSSQWQVIAGLRYDRFGIRYHDNRTDATLHRADVMLSPRLGLLFKPVESLSLYASNSISYLPSSGDQFSSLTDVTKALEPEKFTNYEVGAKWDVAGTLSLTAALYRLDRTNTKAPDPNDPTITLQTGSQRTNGFELGASGNITDAWGIDGGYARQNAFITNTTTSATTGATVPLVPRSTFSLWNRYQVTRTWGVGLGVVHQDDRYAAIDNTVTLPSFTEVDGALYAILSANVRAQVNVENLFNVRYYESSNGNNNIAPGSPRAVRLSLTTAF